MQEEQTKLQGQLHDLRQEIDACIKTTGSHKASLAEEMTKEKGMMQREIALVYTKLQEAKMWTGKCLEAIGSPFPKELRDEAK